MARCSMLNHGHGHPETMGYQYEAGVNASSAKDTMRLKAAVKEVDFCAMIHSSNSHKLMMVADFYVDR